MRHMIIILAFVLNSCTTTHTYWDKHWDMPPEFVDHVKTYMKLTKRTKITSSLRFGNLKKVNGTCFYFDRSIVIDKKRWVRLHPLQREFLILHELGHCELNYKHSTGIMLPSMQPVHMYFIKRDEWMQDFRDGQPSYKTFLNMVF